MRILTQPSDGDNQTNHLSASVPRLRVPEMSWARGIELSVDPPKPTPTASPELVAHWICELEKEREDIYTEVSIVRYCVRNQIEPMPVILTLRAERSGEKVYEVGKTTYTVSQGRWDNMIENDETARCPFPKWFISATSGRQTYGWSDCDDSLRCPKHAHRKADAALEAARRDWLSLDVVYYARVSFDPNVIDRVRSSRRPSRKNARTWFVARRQREGWAIQDEVHFFSDRDLAGPRTRMPPLSWEPLMPEEAIERLAVALGLPGPYRISPSWIGERDDYGGPEADPRASSDDNDPSESGGNDEREGTGEAKQERPAERWIRLPPVSPDIRDEVMDLAVRVAQERWGVTPTTTFFPADIGPVEEWVTVIEGCVRAVRAKRGGGA